MKKIFISLWLLVAACVMATAQTSPTVRVDSLNAMVQLTVPTTASAFSVEVTGSASAVDGPLGGLFVYVSGSSATTNTYSVFKPAATTGRYIRLTTAWWNQFSAATAADSSTYAFNMQRNLSTNVFSIGADNNNTYLQSQANYALHLNKIGNDVWINQNGVGKVAVGTVTSTIPGQFVIGASDSTTNVFSVKGGGSSANLPYLMVNTGATATDFQVTSLTGYSNYALGVGTANLSGGGGSLITAGGAVLGALTGNTIVGGALIVTNSTTLKSSVSVGGGATLKAIYFSSQQLDFPSIEANGVTNLTMTVTGAGTNSTVNVSVTDGAGTAGIIVSGFVSATNTVTIRAANPTLNAIDPGTAVSYGATVFQY